MSLLNPWLLVGALFAAVPIVIHFLNKTRFRVEPFGSMMFLRAAMKVRAQRLRLRQLLLLILRTLALLFLALGLARPVLQPKSGHAADAPTTHVVIFDASLSMNRGQGTENVFRQAKESALRIVDNMHRTDNMHLIWAAEKPEPLMPEASFDKIFLRNKIRNLEPGTGTMNVPRALEQALWSLEHSTLPQRRVYVLTDGHEAGWNADKPSLWEGLKEHLDLVTVEPFIYVLRFNTAAAVENTAVQNLFARSPIIDVFRQTRFVAELVNHGTRNKTVPVTFSVDGVPQDERDMSIPPGVHTAIFEHHFDSPGSHYVSVELPPDDLPQDDKLTQAVDVLRQVPVLLIEGNTSNNPWRADGALITLALEACGEPGQPGLFRVSSRSQTEMDNISPEILERYRVVILANVTSLSEYFMFALERYVERGGGLLIGGGDQPVPSEYNRLFKDGKGLLPALLGDIATYDQRFFQPTFPAGKAGFVLDAFDLSRTRVLNNVKVEKYWRCTMADNAVLLAAFGDAPFLVYKPYGKGRSILWTTSLDHDWTNFPATQDFLPLVQNLLTFLAASEESPINLRPMEPLLYTMRPTSVTTSTAEDEHAAAGTPHTCTLTDPSGARKKLPLTNDSGRWGIRWTETQRIGLYTVEAEGVPPAYFAVQPPPEESAITPLDDEDQQKLAASCPFSVLDNEADLAAEIQKEVGFREWWQPFVLATVAFLCTESFLSWRFSR